MVENGYEEQRKSMKRKIGKEEEWQKTGGKLKK